MADPVAFSAEAIATLTFQKFIESGAGELAQKFTESALQSMDDLRQKIWGKLQGQPRAEAALRNVEQGSKADLEKVTVYLNVAMVEDPQFAAEIRELAQTVVAQIPRSSGEMNQINFDSAKGWQAKVEGGTAYIGEMHFYDSLPHQLSSRSSDSSESFKQSFRSVSEPSKMNNFSAKKILILAANPKNTSSLRLDQEVRDIQEELQRGRQSEFLLEQRWAARSRDVYRAIQDIKPQIIHFSGHGAEDGGLALEDEAGQTRLTTPEALEKLFELFADQVECVVLNACYSGIQADAITQHIPYVVGMSQEIDDRAAIEFAVAFYSALGAGQSVDFAYKLGCAAIELAGIAESAIPVLKKKASVLLSPKLDLRLRLQELENYNALVVDAAEKFRIQQLIKSVKRDIISLDENISFDARKLTLRLVLDGAFDGTAEQKAQAIVEHLRQLSGDASLTLKKVEPGSIVLILEGTEEGLKIIQSLFTTGQLKEVMGLPIKAVEYGAMQSKPFSNKEIEVFFSYSHKDEALRDQLANHLSTLQRQSVIKKWHDRQIGAGAEWAGEIDKHLDRSHIILLLISSDFIASDYCFDKEVKRAMERHEEGEARVIPVILRSVDWDGMPFSKLQALPKDGLPITSWHNQDEAFTNIAKGIRAVVKEMTS